MNKCFLPIALGLSICCNAVHVCSGLEDSGMRRFNNQQDVRAFMDIINRCVENQFGNCVENKLGNLDDIRSFMQTIQVREVNTWDNVLLHLISRYDVRSVLCSAQACVDFSELTDAQVKGFNVVRELFVDNGRIVILANLHNNSQLCWAFSWLVFAIKKATEVCLNAQNNGCTVDNRFIEKYSQVFQLLTQAFEQAVDFCNIDDNELLDRFVKAVEVIRLAYVDNFEYMFWLR